MVDIVEVDSKRIEVHRTYKLSICYMADIIGIGQNTYTNWKKDLKDKRKGARHDNNAKYTEEDKAQALNALALNPDMSPAELQAKYLDEYGIYLGSVRWLYRLLEKNKMNSDRSGRCSSKKDNVERRTLTATAPNQVLVWDITYLYKTNPQGEYYYLYAVMDLYSRKMVHWEVHDIQSAQLAAKFIEKAVQKVGFVKPSDVPIEAEGRNTDIFGKVLELHSDNGAPMRGSTMVAKCLELGISCTYNRPRHSNDNAHMEASFRLLKHGHEVAIPQSFDTLSQAREWVNQYYEWYNNIHRHSGICYTTPAQCYEGKSAELMAKRNQIIDEFFKAHPKQKALVEAIGRKPYWKMPQKAVVMPFYTKRSKIKNKIRACKMDSGDLAFIGKMKMAS
ncbi:MAG: transposase [Lachnospiraceae bacterium]